MVQMVLRAKAPEFAESHLETTRKDSAHQLTMRGSVRHVVRLCPAVAGL